jgi:hypothetical protein
MSELTQHIESFVRSELREVLTSVADETSEAILRHVMTIIQEAIVRERERCVQICLDRAELWGKTSLAHPGAPALARERLAPARTKPLILLTCCSWSPRFSLSSREE